MNKNTSGNFIGKNPAILVCGHGSRDLTAISEFKKLVKDIAHVMPNRCVEYGFLEFAKPTIGQQLDELRNRGIQKVSAVPGMLFAAGHAKNDIPSVLNNYEAQHKEFAISYGRDLAIDTKLLKVAEERILSVIASSNNNVELRETLLVVVGRGTSDPDANSNISKITRMLWEGMGFGWAETCFSWGTTPLVGDALERVSKLGFARIVVFPYFLFTGVLVKRIYEAADLLGKKFPKLEILKAGYLNNHPLVRDTFIQRLEEIDSGQNSMNCQLCKYREQIIGYEIDQGLAQIGHHHHVEGVGTDPHMDSHHKHHQNGSKDE